ncbi:MAG: glycosyltransferase family 39 protein [Planctomycetota bacterium]|nr:glycosyltransferase family 39 protein [Planctomycetota bacterium]
MDDPERSGEVGTLESPAAPNGNAACLTESADQTQQFNDRLIRWTQYFVLLGVGLRLFRYAHALALNGDEVRVGLNIINRNWRDLLLPLDYDQVAPIGFLWCERAVYHMWGMSEYAMRFMPMLAGIATLILFAFWARMLLRPLEAFIATGIIAVGHFIVQHAVEVKPYGSDLLASLLLLIPATLFLLQRRDRWLLLLGVLAPITLAFSYPAVFVGGAVLITLGLQLPRMTWRSRILFSVFGMALATSFLLIFLQISLGQLHKTNSTMVNYWVDAFPPGNPFSLLVWLVDVHTGNLFAYPVGGKHGLSILSFSLFLYGVYVWFKTYRGPAIGLLLLPFALTLIAAALRHYPYGQSERCCQHLVPAIALLLGVGGGNLIERISKSTHRQVELAIVVAVVFLIIAVGVVVSNVLQRGTSQHLAARHFAEMLVSEAKSGATVAVLEPRDNTPAYVQWYLRTSDRIIWNGWADKTWRKTSGELYVVSSQSDPRIEQYLNQQLGRMPESHQTRHFEPIGPMENWNIFVYAPIR